MGMTEKDPRQIAYIALLVAITWYKLIDSEQALRIARGRSSAKPGRKLTPELREQIMKLTENPNFRTFNGIEKKFKINRFDIIESEGKWQMIKIDSLINRIMVALINSTEQTIKQDVIPILKIIKKLCTECAALECEKCTANRIMCGKLTFCDKIMEVEPTLEESKELLENLKISIVRQLCDNCATYTDLGGRAVKRSVRIDEKVIEKIDKYLEYHPQLKNQDFYSFASLEYMERHK